MSVYPELSTDKIAVAECSESHAWSKSELLLGMICILSFIHGAYYLWIGISQPLLDFHSFRQTQTALTAYWLWNGGPWLSYETPVVGAPWSIPFEFPVYQYFVAILKGAGLSIEVGGRAVSFFFYVACLWPLSIALKELQFSRSDFLIVAALFLVSPIYLYWSRTVMIETSALFFCLFWLVLLVRYLRRGESWLIIGAIIFGIIGVLAKSTTFAGFAILGTFAIFIYTWVAWRSRFLSIKIVLLAIAALALPLAVELVWVAFSDAIKDRNAFGALLTSRQLGRQLFGSWQQRITIEFWRDTILLRIMQDIFGYGAMLAAVVLGAGLMERRRTLTLLAMAVAFLAPMLVFTHLHVAHNYYQIANALFVLVAVGLAIGAVWHAPQRLVAWTILSAILLGQIYFFHRHFVPVITADYSQNPLYRIAQLAREKTEPTESLIVIGDDWSSAVPYFSERKALVLMGWAPFDLTKSVLEEPQRFLADNRLGAIIVCQDRLSAYRDKKQLVERFVAGKRVIEEVGGCQLLAP